MKNLWVKILICSLSCLVLGILSGLSTANEITNWYLIIERPTWTPPNWLFGPAWTFLYLSMGAALAIVWHSKHPLKRIGIVLFISQFCLNLLWSFLFFGQHLIDIALIDISVMLILIVATTVVFYKIKTLSGFLLVPYIIWVSYATALNAAICYLN